MNRSETNILTTGRLISLDFLRGLIMVLLMISSTNIFDYVYETIQSQPIHGFFQQFVHHPWNGLRFWDLVQPGFMFIAGVALAFSLTRQCQSGISWSQSFRKVLIRCGWLFFWGVLDYAVRDHHLSFELWDVLTQLSFTTLVAFLIFKWNSKYQIVFCLGLLLLTEFLYRYTNVPNFDQPFTDQHNFGNYIDTILMNKINSDGWVAINCIPTAVHTIAGALAGKLLISSTANKTRRLLIAGFICLLIGYGTDIFGITPIIKRIATSSFVMASLGWCLLALAVCYYWIDVKDHKKRLIFFTIVGMNAIFIYLFFEIVGARWFNRYISDLASGVMDWFHASELLKVIFSAICIFAIEWGICYFLYKRKIFFKL